MTKIYRFSRDGSDKFSGLRATDIHCGRARCGNGCVNNFLLYAGGFQRARNGRQEPEGRECLHCTRIRPMPPRAGTSDASLYSQAEEALRIALQISPDNFEARKVQVCLQLGRHEFARARELAMVLNKRIPG